VTTTLAATSSRKHDSKQGDQDASGSHMFVVSSFSSFSGISLRQTLGDLPQLRKKKEKREGLDGSRKGRQTARGGAPWAEDFRRSATVAQKERKTRGLRWLTQEAETAAHRDGSSVQPWAWPWY
jgi:hypothetical protein